MSAIIWLIVAVVMVVVEIISTTLITIWFFIGALIAAIAAYFGAGFAVQLAIFLVVSIVTLLLFRPMLKRRVTGGPVEGKSSPIGQGEATPLGKTGIVVEAIDNASGKGRVETPDHMSWVALSADGAPIAEGTTVSVVDVQSVKLVVKAIATQSDSDKEAEKE